MTSQRSFFARMFRAVWRFIDGTRKLVLNIVFLLLLYLVVMAVLDIEDTLIIQPDTALVLRPQGDVVEEYSGTPLDHALEQATGSTRSETRLRDLTGVRFTNCGKRLLGLKPPEFKALLLRKPQESGRTVKKVSLDL